MRTCRVCAYVESRDDQREWFPGVGERLCSICFTWYLEVLHALNRGVKSLRDEPEAMIERIEIPAEHVRSART